MRKLFVVIFFAAAFLILHFSSARAIATGNIIPTTGGQNVAVTAAPTAEDKNEQARLNARATAAATRQNFIRERQEVRTQFLEKLKVIRDEKKKTLVNNLENRMNEINQKRTEEMLKHLEKMEEILNRIEQKGAEGIVGDKGSLTAAIATARAAIAAARKTVEGQAAKMYTPNIVNETTLRGVVGQNILQLQQDLKAIREQVIAAKKAVMDAALALARARGNVGVTPVPTGSTP